MKWSIKVRFTVVAVGLRLLNFAVSLMYLIPSRIVYDGVNSNQRCFRMSSALHIPIPFQKFFKHYWNCWISSSADFFISQVLQKIFSWRDEVLRTLTGRIGETGRYYSGCGTSCCIGVYPLRKGIQQTRKDLDNT